MSHLSRLAALLLAAAILPLAGCQSFGFIAANVLPEPKIPALYTPPDQPTVVMIDDPNRVLPSSQEAGLIAARVGEDLKTNKIVTKMLSPTAVEELRLSDPQFPAMAIDKIGQRVGASQVIYILVDSYQILSEPSVYRPTIVGRIKVIDVATGKRTFPAEDPNGHPVKSQMFYRAQDRDVLGKQAVLGRKLADMYGEDVAKLFYEHSNREVGSGPHDLSE